jgi:hypothetical protein
MEIDYAGSTLWISSIFGWYSSDFGRSKRDIILSLRPYMMEEKKKWIEDNLSSLSIRYLPYNWNLNSTLQ